MNDARHRDEQRRRENPKHIPNQHEIKSEQIIDKISLFSINDWNIFKICFLEFGHSREDRRRRLGSDLLIPPKSPARQAP